MPVVRGGVPVEVSEGRYDQRKLNNSGEARASTTIMTIAAMKFRNGFRVVQMLPRRCGIVSATMRYFCERMYIGWSSPGSNLPLELPPEFEIEALEATLTGAVGMPELPKGERFSGVD